AVAIIMSQHMDRAVDSELRQQRLLQIGLLDQAVGVPTRFGGIAEAEHVARNQPIARRQWMPDRVPVPAGGGETMDQQQRLAFASRPVADALVAESELAGAGAPPIQRYTVAATHS